MSDSLLTAFPLLACDADPQIEAMLANAQQVAMPAQQTIYRRGDACRHYILMLSGTAKVVLTAPNGREVVLYRVNSGESCVLTTAGLLGGDRYPADGLSETPIRALLVDSASFDATLEASKIFRQFVFSNMGQRLSQVILRMEQVKFGDIDARLAGSLLSRLQGQTSLTVTHQELALEIGSAREVVSRHLKQLEAQGCIRLGRGVVEIVQPEPLRALARGE